MQNSQPQVGAQSARDLWALANVLRDAPRTVELCAAIGDGQRDREMVNEIEDRLVEALVTTFWSHLKRREGGSLEDFASAQRPRLASIAEKVSVWRFYSQAHAASVIAAWRLSRTHDGPPASWRVALELIIDALAGDTSIPEWMLARARVVVGNPDSVARHRMIHGALRKVRSFDVRLVEVVRGIIEQSVHGPSSPESSAPSRTQAGFVRPTQARHALRWATSASIAVARCSRSVTRGPSGRGRSS